jgi:hypothetical protein
VFLITIIDVAVLHRFKNNQKAAHQCVSLVSLNKCHDKSGDENANPDEAIDTMNAQLKW